jgi:hypothetical protein
MTSSTRGQRSLVVGSVRRIISGVYSREPLHADGVDLGDPVLEGGALNLIFDIAISQSAFKSDELPLLEGFGELGEIAPGEDAMPFGAGFVLAFVVLPALLGCDVEDDVLFVVLSGFGFCVLPEAADEDDFVEHGVGLRFFWFVRCLRYMLAQRVPSRPTPSATGQNLRKGTQLALGQESAPLERRAADSGKESVRPKGGGVLSAAR